MISRNVFFVFILYTLGVQAVFITAMVLKLYDDKDKIPQKALLSWIGLIIILTDIYKRRGIDEKD